MVIDTSAMIAIVANEPACERLMDAIAQDRSPKMSAATAVELQIVMIRHLSLAPNSAAKLLEASGISVVGFDEAQLRIAHAAYAAYDLGSGSKPRLNFGDCFSYALAKHLGEPLLFVGDDFAHTDVTPAPF